MGDSSQDPVPARVRTALVTGAGSGIGRAVSIALAHEGWRVLAVGRREEALEDTLRDAGAELRQALVPIAGDVREARLRKRLDERAPDGIDVLVHVAMAFAPYARVENSEPEAESAMIDTGLGAALALARHVMPGMRARGFGRIVLIGSMAGSLGAPEQAAYSAAKSGLVGLARSLALEGARDGVTCNLLELGLVDTERVRRALAGERWKRLVASTPVGRAGRPEEVARAVSWLVARESGFVTGACIPVSGGLGLGLVPPRDSGD